MNGKSPDSYMKRILTLALLLTMSCGVGVAQTKHNMKNYRKDWENVEQLKATRKPQSAIKAVRAIYDDASANGNFPQLLKAALTLTGLRESLSPDSLAADAQMLESLGTRCGNAADRAVWHALMASFYANLDYSRGWAQIDETNVSARNAKAEAHRDSVLADMDALAGWSLEAYAPLYSAGTDSRRMFNNDVLSAVWRDGVKLTKQSRRDDKDALDVLGRMEILYAGKGMRDAALLCRLEALRVRHGMSGGTARLSNRRYVETLQQLYQANRDTEAGADVCWEYLENAPLTYAQKDSLIGEALSSWPESRMAKNFRACRQRCRNSELSLAQGEGIAVAGEPLQVVFRHRNVHGCALSISDDKRDIVRKDIVFRDSGMDWTRDSITLTLPAGRYHVTAQSDNRTDTATLHLSRWRVMVEGASKQRKTAIVLDAMTGRPVADALVVAKWSKRVNREWKNYTRTSRTDADGRAALPEETKRVYAEKDGDQSVECAAQAWDNVSSSPQASRLCYNTFTDRAIYRPGQTIHVCGLVYRQEGDATAAAVDEEVEIRLRDANWEEVASQQLRTDEWGMVSCDLTVPEGRLTGRYTVSVGRSSRQIRVEEYKRPTFEVEFLPLEGAFALGDTVTLQGEVKTYSGVPVSKARVSYTVRRSKTSFFRWWMCPEEESTDVGEIQTDNDGRFSMRVALSDEQDTPSEEGLDAAAYSDDDEKDNINRLFTFRVTAQVTDQAGESHDAETSVRVSRQPFGLSVAGGKTIDLHTEQAASFQVKALNANGKEVEAEGTWELRAWNKADKDYTDTKAAGEWNTAKPFSPSLNRLPLGSYQLRLRASHEEVETSWQFVLWNSSDTTTRLNLAEDFLLLSDTEMDSQRGVDIWFAPACEDAYTFLYMISADSLFRETQQSWQPNLHHLHLDYQTWMGDGAEVVIAYVRDNVVHRKRETITLRKPDKQLQLSWQTFRDRLQPGQQETWTLRVTHPDGSAAKAEVLTAMYDASLNALAKHQWDMDVNFSRSVPSLRLNFSAKCAFPSFTVEFPWNISDGFSRKWNTLRYYSEYQETSYGMRLYSSSKRMARTLTADGAMPLSEAAGDFAVAASLADDDSEEATTESAAVKSADMGNATVATSTAQPRENFAETAFFYPNLLTDKHGDATIQFTLPESLTEWKVMALAHTTEICYGQLEGTVTARKDFMVQPQLPRFVREGDSVNIATRLINTSAQALRGTAQFSLTDAATGKSLCVQSAPFELQAGETRTVTFAYTVPQDAAGLLVCEVTGQSDRFSDGERNYLPVLTNRKTLYETVPFYLTEAGEKDVDLTSLFNGHSATATHRLLTIDYTDNPSWTAVMALHSLINPKSDSGNAMDWAASLYANCVAQSIAQRLPRLQELLQSWKQESGKDRTLASELQKNEELKEILLQETPWVLDAKHESEERERLSELFDADLLGQRIREAQEKLYELQCAKSGWSWMEGMPENYYVTLSVCEHLARLSRYISRNPLPTDAALDATRLATMLQDGIAYLDKEEWERYNKYYRKHDDRMPSESSCHYLYVKTLTGESEEKGDIATLTNDYLTRVSKHIGDLTLYGQASMSLVLLHHNRQKAALDFVSSLREYLVQREGMGRYFDTKLAYYSWQDYRIPTHVAAMRAFQATASRFADSEEVLRDMQLWLLRQKQAQHWDNVLHTLDVCDLLLTIQPDTTFHATQLPTLSLDGHELEVGNATAGTGYVKVGVEEPWVDAKYLTVKKTSPGISWGCAYGQSLEELTRVEQSANTELRIERTLYRHTPQADGTTEWQQLADGEPLHVGDRLRLRLRVQADRDMDFLQLRCQRAACMEPVNQLSGYQWLGGRGGYLAHGDTESDLFFDTFTKGSATVDLEFYVTHAGRYNQGIATVQSAYCPAFSAHSAGMEIEVEAK